MTNIALFPGSFFPFHEGHKKIIEIALENFEKIVVLVANNENKFYSDDLQTRREIISEYFKNEPRIEVKILNPLEKTAIYCKKRKIINVIRGFRDVFDFKFESYLRSEYKKLNSNLNFFYVETGIQTSSSEIRLRIREEKEQLKYEKELLLREKDSNK